MSPFRLLEAGHQLTLVVADAPRDRYGAEPIEHGLRDLGWVSACAVAHEAVVEHFANAGTVLPMKLFTLFDSDERALEHVRRTRTKLDRLLKRVAGREEWGVRLALDEARAQRAVRATAHKGASGLTSGTGFLMRKKVEHEALRDVVERARGQADRVFDDLVRRADDSRRRTPEQDGARTRVLLDAAFLVPARRAGEFRRAVRSLAGNLNREGYDLTLTGPWPPYNFVTESR